MKPEQVIAKRLREAREELGLTLEAVGVLAGIDEATAKVRMSQYENARHTPPISMLFKLALALKKPPAWFIVEDELKEPLAIINTLNSTAKSKFIVELQKQLEDSK
ncbi:Helix-turn-helix domain-containing protein [Methylophilus rhizosphaerae]|uniref:Helix-turn-helix domain-containing protein n=1 Tax=Methylophilus rhizosphaerae TaxID=492660 RepID=A0A1G9CNU2_9PROT|nr:helix-turn-helix transcriptional regulator [Methylophilus rhizosphaerae]SDK53318.1 Helix-turn-helix domain-containing protein [Methylophilus rhizosphaerae]